MSHEQRVNKSFAYPTILTKIGKFLSYSCSINLEKKRDQHKCGTATKTRGAITILINRGRNEYRSGELGQGLNSCPNRCKVKLHIRQITYPVLGPKSLNTALRCAA
jgi:hypothetical protein